MVSIETLMPFLCLIYQKRLHSQPCFGDCSTDTGNDSLKVCMGLPTPMTLIGENKRCSIGTYHRLSRSFNSMRNTLARWWSCQFDSSFDCWRIGRWHPCTWRFIRFILCVCCLFSQFTAR